MCITTDKPDTVLILIDLLPNIVRTLYSNKTVHVTNRRFVQYAHERYTQCRMFVVPVSINRAQK